MNISDRKPYIISFIAIFMALISIFMQMGNKIIDIKNTCYYVYVSAPVVNGKTLSDDEFLEQTDKVIAECNIPGFPIVKNLQGASSQDGKLTYKPSYQIILMDISKKNVKVFIQKLLDSFNKSGAHVEEVVTNFYYFKNDKKE